MKPWERFQKETGPWTRYQPKGPEKPAEMPLEDKRAMVADGMTLRVGPWDTGVEMPQWLSEGLAGVGRRMTEIGTLGTHEGDENADQLLDDSRSAAVGGALTDIGAITLGGAALKGASAIPKIGGLLSKSGQALTAPQKLTQAVAGGSAYGAATSSDRLSGAVGGGLGGGAGYGVTKLAGNLLKPALQEGAEKLAKQGVKMTPGELLGGWVQRVEDGATSIPFVGDFIRNSKRMSLKSFNRSLVDDALEVVGTKLDDSIPAGREALARADDILSQRYDDILEGMNTKLDPEFIGEFNSIAQMVNKLPKNQINRFNRFVGEGLVKQFDNPNQLLLGKTFKRVDSGMRKEYKRLLKSGDPDVQDLGSALRELHSSLLNMAKRQNPELAEQLAKTDKAYAMMQRINDAAASPGAQDGVFTPAQLLASVRRASTKKTYAKGQAYGQDIAETAKGILPATVPDSGTPLRAMTGAAALGGGAMIEPTLAAGLLSGAALYTNPAQRFIQPLISQRPESLKLLGQGLKDIAPRMGLLGTAVGVNVPQ